MEKPKKPRILRFIWLSLTLILVLAVAGAAGYFASDLNSRTYQLRQQGNMLLIEKGRFLPYGYETYRPTEAKLQQAYAPIPLAAGHRVAVNQRFSNRSDLDRAIFATLAEWARGQLAGTAPNNMTQIEQYIARAQALPGISEQQHDDLGTLRANLAFHRGQRIIGNIRDQLQTARTHFEQAIELGTSHGNKAREWILWLTKKLEANQDGATTETKDPPTPTNKEHSKVETLEPKPHKTPGPTDKSPAPPTVEKPAPTTDTKPTPRTDTPPPNPTTEPPDWRL